MFGLIGTTNLAICQSLGTKPLRLEFNFEKAEPLKMSEIISKISYIPLETNSKCLLGNMWIYVFGKDILVRSLSIDESIYRFSTEGKYLNKIGSKGNGPGEFIGCSDMFLQGDTVYVVPSFTNAILCYSLSGEFIKRYKVDIKNKLSHVVKINAKSYMIALSSEHKLGNLIKTDREFKIQSGFFKELPMSGYGLSHRFQRSKDKIFYFDNFHYTVYDISNEYPIPSIVVDFGKYKTSNQKLSLYPKVNIILNNPWINSFYSSSNYYKFDFYYPYKRSEYSMLYRISDGKRFVWTKLINNIDNGTLDRWTGFLADDKLVFHLMPLTILERYKDMTKEEKLNPANSAFVKMASKISAESNPVIMVCKLK